MPTLAGIKSSFPRASENEIDGKIKLQTDAAIMIPAEKPLMMQFSFLLISFFITKIKSEPIVVATKMTRQPKIVMSVLFIFSP